MRKCLFTILLSCAGSCLAASHSAPVVDLNHPHLSAPRGRVSVHPNPQHIKKTLSQSVHQSTRKPAPSRMHISKPLDLAKVGATKPSPAHHGVVAAHQLLSQGVSKPGKPISQSYSVATPVTHTSSRHETIIRHEKRNIHEKSVGAPVISAQASHLNSDLSRQIRREESDVRPVTTFAVTENNTWMMPANGPILMTYNAEHKGISIGGEVGDPIYAASSGKVVFASNRLKGYGNLLIIKHNNQYLSAYAYNRLLKVKLGDHVRKGQVIGEMGRSQNKKALLYFEIRKDGKSINPALIQGII